jgi:hypothetical protein
MDFSLIFLVVSMVIFTAAVATIIYFFKRKVETEEELELKQLRQMFFSGKLDKKSFIRVKNRMKIENMSSVQKEHLEEMRKNETIDSTTYVRMKKALKISLDERLRKLNTKF